MAEKPVVVWQLGEALRTALRKNDSKAVPVIRLVGTRPSWDGALRTELDIPVEVSAGHLQVPQLSDVDYVRAALGFKLGASFRPLLLGIEAGADDGVRFRPRQMSAAMANAALEQAKVLSQA
jgi:hypothetical protein